MSQLLCLSYIFVSIVFFSSSYVVTAEKNISDTVPLEIKKIIYYQMDIDTFKSMRNVSKKEKQDIDNLFSYITYKLDVEKLTEFFSDQKGKNISILDCQIDIQKFLVSPMNVRNSTIVSCKNKGPFDHNSKKCLTHALADSIIIFEALNLNGNETIPKIRNFLNQFCIYDDYYVTSIIRRLIHNTFLVLGEREREKTTREAIEKNIKNCYENTRSEKIFSYLSFLHEECEKLELESEYKKPYRWPENKSHNTKMINRHAAEYYKILFSIQKDPLLSLKNLDANLLIQTTNKAGNENGSKVVRLYQMLYVLDRKYSMHWFLNWFQEAVARSEIKEVFSIIERKEMHEIFCNKRVLCPLFKKTATGLTIYQILKNNRYQVYHLKYKVWEPLYKEALSHYLAVAPLFIIKQSEQKLYEIINDIVDIADLSVILPWQSGVSDQRYKIPYLYISILKSANVFFYEELKEKLMQKTFLSNSVQCDFEKNVLFVDCENKLLNNTLNVLLFINYANFDQFFALIKQGIKQEIDQRKLISFLYLWISYADNYRYAENLLIKMRQEKHPFLNTLSNTIKESIKFGLNEENETLKKEKIIFGLSLVDEKFGNNLLLHNLKIVKRNDFMYLLKIYSFIAGIPIYLSFNKFPLLQFLYFGAIKIEPCLIFWKFPLFRFLYCGSLT